MKDKEVEKLMKAEKERQKKQINLIPSENFVSQDVLEALGSEFVNKYSEGYPGKRYYCGQVNADKIELLCQKRALKLFKLSPEKWHVNVQALSGSPANLAVYFALVPPGGKIMGMTLDNGGHLTHGHKVSATGKFWTQVPYGVNKETEVLDYEELKKIAIENKPNIIVAGYTAYPRTIDFKKFREIADAVDRAVLDSQLEAESGKGVGEKGLSPLRRAESEVNVENREVLKSELSPRKTILMVDMSHFAGLVAGSAYPSPFEYADIVTTTVHKTLRGPRSALIYAKKDSRELGKLIDKAIFPGLQGGPHMNQIAAVAVCLKEASSPEFKKYAKQVVKNTKVLSDELKKLGWKIISDGTDSHLILMDTWLGGKGISGTDASVKLEKAGIIVNKNTIPNETRSPFDPSGIRLGAAFETTKGKKEKDMIKIAKQIDQILRKK
jgi:glycine hydroxymethyltransferase